MICTKRGHDKPPSEFHKQRGGSFPWCKACRKDYDREYHKSRWESGIKQKEIAARVERNHQVIRDWVLAHPCVDCGETDPIVLEFDHQGDKRANVSEMVRWASVETLQEEFDKCEVVCANCHRRRTSEAFGWWVDTRV